MKTISNNWFTCRAAGMATDMNWYSLEIFATLLSWFSFLLVWSQNHNYSYATVPKTEPFKIRTLKCTDFEWVPNLDVWYSSPNCIKIPDVFHFYLILYIIMNEFFDQASAFCCNIFKPKFWHFQPKSLDAKFGSQFSLFNILGTCACLTTFLDLKFCYLNSTVGDIVCFQCSVFTCGTQVLKQSFQKCFPPIGVTQADVHKTRHPQGLVMINIIDYKYKIKHISNYE